MKQWELTIDGQLRYRDPDLDRVFRLLAARRAQGPLPRVTLRRTLRWVHPSMQVVPLKTSKWS